MLCPLNVLKCSWRIALFENLKLKDVLIIFFILHVNFFICNSTIIFVVIMRSFLVLRDDYLVITRLFSRNYDIIRRDLIFNLILIGFYTNVTRSQAKSISPHNLWHAGEQLYMYILPRSMTLTISVKPSLVNYNINIYSLCSY